MGPAYPPMRNFASSGNEAVMEAEVLAVEGIGVYDICTSMAIYIRQIYGKRKRTKKR